MYEYKQYKVQDLIFKKLNKNKIYKLKSKPINLDLIYILTVICYNIM
jgi:hypothetical protein